MHAVHPRVQRRLLCVAHVSAASIRKTEHVTPSPARLLTRYPLNMDPMKADAKKMHALFASSVLLPSGSSRQRPARIGTEEQGGVRGQQTLFGVPAAQHRVHCRVERAFCQADLLSARTYTRESARAVPSQAESTTTTYSQTKTK